MPPDSIPTTGVSIIMPVFNAASYLPRSLQSVRQQSFTDLELICIDDGSSDDSARIIEEQAKLDPRIKSFRLEANSGAPAARNTGIDHAKGEFLLFMDADDELFSDALSTLVSIARQNGSDAVKGCMQREFANGKRYAHSLNQKRAWENTCLDRCDEIQHLYQYQSYLFRTAIIASNQTRFDTSLANFQDPVFLAFLLPECARIDLVLDSVYIRIQRDHSIISSSWGYRNYSSLIRGIEVAYKHLLDKNQVGAAEKMALNIGRWWYKFEPMTDNLSNEQCMLVCQKIHAFGERSRHPLSSLKLLKISAYYYLRLIMEGDHEKCITEMEKQRRLSHVLPRPLIKIRDLARAIPLLVSGLFR